MKAIFEYDKKIIKKLFTPLTAAMVEEICKNRHTRERNGYSSLIEVAKLVVPVQYKTCLDEIENLPIAERLLLDEEIPTGRDITGIFIFNKETNRFHYFSCGYMGHYSLFEDLRDEKYVPYHQRSPFNADKIQESRWDNDPNIFHVSRGTVNGTLVFSLTHAHMKDYDVEFYGKAFDFLVELAKNNFISRTFSETEPILLELVKAHSKLTGKGSKYANLMFLKKHYPSLPTPKISLAFHNDYPNLRTSPKYSMPGVLNSRFGITAETNEQAVGELHKEFEECNTIAGNELHYFYQEHVKGATGVCNILFYSNGQYTFNYTLNTNQHESVKTGKGNVELTEAQLKSLKKHLEAFSNGWDSCSIQLEFAVKGNKVIVLQFRVFYNNTPSFTAINVHALTLVGKGKIINWKGDKRQVEITAPLKVFKNADIHYKETLKQEALFVEDPQSVYSHAACLAKTVGKLTVVGVELNEFFNPALKTVVNFTTEGAEFYQ